MEEVIPTNRRVMGAVTLSRIGFRGFCSDSSKPSKMSSVFSSGTISLTLSSSPISFCSTAIMQATAVKSFESEAIHWTESIWKGASSEASMVRLPKAFE